MPREFNPQGQNVPTPSNMPERPKPQPEAKTKKWYENNTVIIVAVVIIVLAIAAFILIKPK